MSSPSSRYEVNEPPNLLDIRGKKGRRTAEKRGDHSERAHGVGKGAKRRTRGGTEEGGGGRGGGAAGEGGRREEKRR